MAKKDTRTYWEKLKDPRWQKIRLEVLGAEKFCCEVCGDSESTLHVHHGYYRKGAEPWDYPTDSLHALCESCHDNIGMETKEIHERLALLRPELLFDVVKLLNEFEDAWPFHYVIRDEERWAREHVKDEQPPPDG